MTESCHAPLNGTAEADVEPVVTAVHAVPAADTVLVQRWKRHGNDRAYVKVNNVQVGYRDVITTEIHCLDESHRATIESATEHLVRNRGNRLTAPGVAQPAANIAAAPEPADAPAGVDSGSIESAPTASASTESAPTASASTESASTASTAVAESSPQRTGAPHASYVARHIDPRYVPAGSSAPADPAAPRPTDAAEGATDGASAGRRRWFRRR